MLGVPLYKAAHELNGHDRAHRPAQIIPTADATDPMPKVYTWDDAGPPVRAVRVKIKRDGGGYVNWYRVSDEGWQAKQPDHYKPIPYRSARNRPVRLRTDR